MDDLTGIPIHYREDAKICHLATSKAELHLCDRKTKAYAFLGGWILGLEMFETRGVTEGETSDKI